MNKLISLNSAFSIVMKKAKPLAPQDADLPSALNHVLFQPVKADRDNPPANLSAMDGYAVRSADVKQSGAALRIIGECAAGIKPSRMIRAGQAMRIYTGAMLPPGADAVVMLEYCREQNGAVVLDLPARRWGNVFRKGENARRGAVLLKKGGRIGAQQIGLCAAVGAAKLSVHSHPKIVIICTGEELRTYKEKVKINETRNSNGPMLCAALSQQGFQADYMAVPDDLAKITAAIKKHAKNNHVLILTGGASKGKYDYVREAIQKSGGEILFHGVDVKPGKPQMFAEHKSGALLFGLPGNPVSAAVGFYELALPAIKRLVGYSQKNCRPEIKAMLTKTIQNKGDRLRLALGCLSVSGSQFAFTPVSTKGSSDVVSCGYTDGVMIVLKGVQSVEAGVEVVVHPWSANLR